MIVAAVLRRNAKLSGIEEEHHPFFLAMEKNFKSVCTIILEYNTTIDNLIPLYKQALKKENDDIAELLIKKMEKGKYVYYNLGRHFKLNLLPCNSFD